jgi:Domain of Unknown Function (DUF1080)
MKQFLLLLLLLGFGACSSSLVESPRDSGANPVDAGISADAGIRFDAGWLDADVPDAAPSDAGSQPDAGDFEDLFDGTLNQFDTYLGIPNGETVPLGLGNDPKKVFSVAMQDGEPVIRISGEVWGALVTKREFSNMQLHVEYRRGQLQWPPLLFFDSGVMYLSVGPWGAVNAGGNVLSNPIGSGSFLVSLEFQIAQNDVGSLYNLGPISKMNAPAQLVAEGPGWNSIDIVITDSTIAHFLNGTLVATATDRVLNWPSEAPRALKRGKIQLQSEGSEIWFRNVRVKPMPEALFGPPNQ